MMINSLIPRPREEGDISFSSFSIFSENFNPRPREEGDKSKGVIFMVYE